MAAWMFAADQPPNFGNAGSGFSDPVTVVYGGYDASLEYFIEPEKSSTMATSRGRWTAVAVASAGRPLMPSSLAKNVGWLPLTVTRTADQFSVAGLVPVKLGVNFWAVES